MNKCNLVDLSNNQKAIILGIKIENISIKKRLIELGLVKNQPILMIKNNKWSKTLTIGVKGYVLALDYVVSSLIEVVF